MARLSADISPTSQATPGRLSAPAPPAAGSPVAEPDRMFVLVPGLSLSDAIRLSRQAVLRARVAAPKLTGRSAASIETYCGQGFIGLKWGYNYLWSQEAGTRPRTMRSLAGKTIPMWLDDPTGRIAAKNPKARTRITQAGRRQVLIFRRAAAIGARKQTVTRDTQGRLHVRDVPASYPGAPGRIAQRNSLGQIYSGQTRPHVGVRWRHPGLTPRNFLHHALTVTAQQAGISDPTVNISTRRR